MSFTVTARCPIPVTMRTTPFLNFNQEYNEFSFRLVRKEQKTQYESAPFIKILFP
jgi:hypothetical protein